MIPILALLSATLINIPRVGSSYVDTTEYNDAAIEFKSLKNLEYISFVRIDWKIFWYETMYKIHDQFDFILPLVCLITLNILSYRNVKQVKKARNVLTSNQTKEIRPAKMFLPVVSFLLFCNFGVILAFVMVYRNNVLFRELYLACIWWNALNSSANFVIYYSRAKAFRQKTRKIFFVS